MIRTIRRLIPLIIAAAFATGWAWAGSQPAHVALAGRELPLSPLPVFEGGTVWAPVKVLDFLGASYTTNTSGVTINVDGTAVTIPAEQHNSVSMLSMTKVADALDAERLWNDGTSTLNLLSKVKSVEYADGKLNVYLSVPAVYKLNYWKSPDRLSIDIVGSKRAAPANEVYIGTSDVQKARLGQFDDQTARVVLDLNKKIGYKIISSPLTKKIEIQIGNARVAQQTQTTQQQPTAPVVTAKPVSPPTVKDVTLSGVTTESLGDDRLRIVIATDKTPFVSYRMLENPLRLSIDIAGAKSADLASEISVDHPLVKDIRTEQNDRINGTSIVVELSRYLAYSVSSVDETGVVLDVHVPYGAGGNLRDKLIIIDPGHGGPQKGTQCAGVYEKNVNLALAKHVAQKLQEAGARVIMTRDGDYNLDSSLSDDLKKRPGTATSYGADVFISIHCNAVGLPNGPSGTETYYRQEKADSYALASAVHESVLKRTGMKDRGVRSDSKLYGPMGLAVLRYSTVPAILIESGYLDNNSDRSKLTDPDFQDKFAAGVVDGVRLYIEGKKAGEIE